MIRIKEEKPQYGWYVQNIIIAISIIGSIGLVCFIFGFYFQGPLGLLLVIIGASLILLFLWPGIGMTIMHLVYLKKINLITKMKALDEIKTPEILDVGCGTGRTALRIAKALKNGGHLYGIDIYSSLAIGGNALETVENNARIEGVEDKTTFKYGSATEIPFEDNRFDIVDISSVMHELHTQEKEIKALNEIFRVIKPDGYLYLSEWNRSSGYLIAIMGIFSFVFKSKKYWLDLLKRHNFKDINYESINGFGIFTARK